MADINPFIFRAYDVRGNGKDVLRVDLTTGSSKDENLPEEAILKKFIGGQALLT